MSGVRQRRRPGRRRGVVKAAKVVTAERRRLLLQVAAAVGGVRVRPDYRVNGWRETEAERRVRLACTQAGWIETIWGCGAYRMTWPEFMQQYADDAARARAWTVGWRPLGDRLTEVGRAVLGDVVSGDGGGGA